MSDEPLSTKDDDSKIAAEPDDEEDLGEIEPLPPPPAPPPANQEPRDNVESKFVLSPRVVAVGSALTGVACLTALAIVASVTDADALATIAITLAILAFVVQLLVYVAQGQAITQQMLRSEQLNTETRSLLSGMQATAQATERMVRDQFSQLLRAFMDAARTAEQGKTFDPDEFERRLTANIRREALRQEAASPSQTAPAAGGSVDVSRRERDLRQATERVRRRREANDLLLRFPSEEEAAPILAKLEALSPEALSYLRTFMRDKAQAIAGTTSYEGFDPDPDSSDEELREQGLLKLVRLSNPPRVVYQLTDDGTIAARVLTGTGEIPPWAERFIKPPAGSTSEDE